MTIPLTPEKPSPVVQPWARPFWEAARERRLDLQYCATCDRCIHYPRIECPYCANAQLEWRSSKGRGSIYSFTVVHSNAPSAFSADMPYVVAVIRLDEGVQMLSNIVQCDPAELRCDQAVEVVFEPLNAEFTLPKFKPV